MQQAGDNFSLFFLKLLHKTLADGTEQNKTTRELLTQVHVFKHDGESTQWGAFVERFLALWDVSGFFQTHLVIQLADGSWLNIDYTGHTHEARITDIPFWVITLECIALVILLLFIMRRLVQPLRILAKAAEEFGTSGCNARTISEEGSIEVRQAANAFNAMQERFRNMLEHRAHVSAALAHDLRTPLTRMRLHVEELQQKDVREKLLEDAFSLESIAEMSLAFVKSERHTETLVCTDMQALLEAIVEDRRDMEEDVSLLGKELELSAWIYPVALRRCLENLLDNAVRYGKTATVSASLDESVKMPVLRIDIDDCGPGMEVSMLEKVFEPFFRIESSRNSETGGHGLGLSIARNIATLHNAALHLHNRPEGGLCARLELPLLTPET
jgi:signal transduction histidine kinase